MSIEENEVRVAFEEMNVVLAGRPFSVVCAALQDLLVASICFAMDSKIEAKAFCEEVHGDLQRMIDKNFDHYHDPKNAATAAKRRSH